MSRVVVFLFARSFAFFVCSFMVFVDCCWDSSFLLFLRSFAGNFAVCSFCLLMFSCLAFEWGLYGFCLWSLTTSSSAHIIAALTTKTWEYKG